MNSITAQFVRAYPPAVPDLRTNTARYLAFANGELVVIRRNDMDNDQFALPTELPADISAENLLYLGILNNIAYIAYAVIESAEDDAAPLRQNLRALYGKLSDDEYAIAGYALHLLHWQTISRFCGRCGTAFDPLPNSWAKECPACQNISYPSVSPAMLCLVHDGADRLLLAQKSSWGTRYSILAGFVEPGESLEACVLREIEEEVGLVAENPVYDGSQPWPFPHQIMIGFTAVCRESEKSMRLDEAELSHAAWFRYDELPDLPPPLSLSRQIIDRWVESRIVANR